MPHCQSVKGWPPCGWWCCRRPGHDGPCALRPKWWNLRAFLAATA